MSKLIHFGFDIYGEWVDDGYDAWGNPIHDDDDDDDE